MLDFMFILLSFGVDWIVLIIIISALPWYPLITQKYLLFHWHFPFLIFIPSFVPFSPLLLSILFFLSSSLFHHSLSPEE